MTNNDNMTISHDAVMLECQAAGSDWRVLPAFLPVPGLGGLAVNAFLLKGAEPVLVDTGLATLGEAFVEALEAEIDLDDLRWIWLSHTDADHIGNLARILERAPRARVVTNFLGMGKMGMLGHDLSRVQLLEPTTLLSGHLPVACQGVERLTALVHDAWCVGPSSGIAPDSLEAVAAEHGLGRRGPVMPSSI